MSVRYTIQVNLDSGGGWQQAQDSTTNSVIFNKVIDGGAGSIILGDMHTFTQPGEYRILTQEVEQFSFLNNSCTTGPLDTTLIFNFGDDNYTDTNNCSGAPA